MPSPAERYAAARARQANRTPEFDAFAQTFPFALDDFQTDAARALERGQNVLVAAPTGSGKTVVGEFAVHLALAQGGKAFYTTPIKALSNQKFLDLQERFGAERVGLLTGDNSINSEADVVVMTTEVLRNMLYASSRTLRRLTHVVMDEVHYLADRSRGAVWEEVIIHLPQHVRLAALSATVSNAEEFGEWLATVRGDTEVIVSEHRPVPLWQYVITGSGVRDLFVDDEQHRINPELERLARQQRQEDKLARSSGSRRGGRGRRGRSKALSTPSRAQVIRRLEAADLLPAITFIFSRVGCEAAVDQCLNAGLRLTTSDEARQIQRILERRCAHIPDEDLAILGYDTFADALERGIAAHHAGMLPTFKEAVEEAFSAGLVKAVFATETLALGINMPARSVVIERLVKYNGETHVDITPGEFTQLTGRAGRRGIDHEGHALVVWHDGLDPTALAGLASTRTYPLRSSFRPSYNMAVNLVAQMGQDRARELLETSFAQFQSDRSVVGLATELRKLEQARDGYRESAQCHLGDFTEYAALRDQLSRIEKEQVRSGAARRRDEAAISLERLRPGDIIFLTSGRRSGPAVVLDSGLSKDADPRPQVLTAERQVRRLSIVDFPHAPEVVGHLRIPKSFHARSASARRDLASALREQSKGLSEPRRKGKRSGGGESDVEIQRLRSRIRKHPCHGCDEREQHARWAERAHRLDRQIDGISSSIKQRTNNVARQFDRVCAVLEDLGYLQHEPNESPDETPAGTPGGELVLSPAARALRRIHGEQDLLASACLADGIWNDLSPAELAAAVSLLVYESRPTDDEGEPSLPTERIRLAAARTAHLAGELRHVEHRHKVHHVRELDAGFAGAAYRWASGSSLTKVLRSSNLLPGDFVRWSRQLIDLLLQIAQAAEADPALAADAVAGAAREAADLIARGVVAYSVSVSG